jgi:hypothetical protein
MKITIIVIALLSIFLGASTQGVDSLIYTTASFSTNLLKDPKNKSEAICNIKNKDSIAVCTDYFERPFLKVKYKEQIGYLSFIAIDLNNDLRKFMDSKSGRNITSSKATSTIPSSGNGNNNETKTYNTGPRGGQYYINSKGNKVYKKK